MSGGERSEQQVMVRRTIRLRHFSAFDMIQFLYKRTRISIVMTNTERALFCPFLSHLEL